MIAFALNHYQVYLLILLRIVGFFITSPLFSMNMYPQWAKLGFAGFIALMVVPSVHGAVPSSYFNAGAYVVEAVKEAGIGLLFGLVANTLYSVVSVAGEILDLEMGYGAVSLLNPTTGQSSNIMGTLQGVLFGLYFIGMNGLDGLVLFLMNSYKLVPLGHFVMPHDFVGFLTYLLSLLFTMSLQMVIPLVCVLFFTDVTLAVIARVMPQLNVYFVGLPAKLFLGISLFGTMMVGLTYFFGQIFSAVFNQMDVFLKWFG